MPLTVEAMAEPPITKQAAYGVHPGNLPILDVVIHDEEYPVGDHSAESVAQFFAGPSARGSAHYVEDADSEQHCVPEDHTAAHAPPNHGTVGLEQDGYAHFTVEDWAQPGSQATIRRTAARVADICDRHGVPKAWRTPDELRAGQHGIQSHLNRSLAFGQSDHTDPGPNYPVHWFMSLVLGVAPTDTTGNTPSPQEDELVQLIQNADATTQAEKNEIWLASGMFRAHVPEPKLVNELKYVGVPGPTAIPGDWFDLLVDVETIRK